MTMRRLANSPYYEVFSSLNLENQTDQKVSMINEIDMSSAERLRAQAKAAGLARPTYTALVMKALSNALREHPYANRMAFPGWFGARQYQFDHIDISVAVERDQPGGEQRVYVDTVRGADAKNLSALTAELSGFAQATPESHPRWRLFSRLVERSPRWFSRFVLSLPRRLPGMWAEHRGGVAMISSPAKYGVDAMVATWPYPIGISFGLVKPRPVAVGQTVEVRPTMSLLMSFDRRIMAGAPAARFFKTMSEQLADAEHRLSSSQQSVPTSAVAVAS